MGRPKQKIFNCDCGWVVRGGELAKSAKAKGTCSEGSWVGKGGDQANAVKPTQKQPLMTQQPQPNQPGYSPAFNAWIGTNTMDAQDEREEDGGNAQGAGANDSGGSVAGLSDAEAAAMKLEGLRDDEACCKAQIAAAKLQKGPLAAETLRNAEELLRTIEHEIRMTKPIQRRLKELHKAERDVVKTRDRAVNRYVRN